MTIKEDKEILGFEENMVSLRDFEERDDLLIENMLEKFSFLKMAQEARVMFSFYLREYGNNKFDDWVKFSSYLFIDQKDTIEIEINRNFYKQLTNPSVYGVCFLNNIKIVFEAVIIKAVSVSEDIVGLTLGMPIRMIRYQRRDSFRAKVPPYSKISIDLDTSPNTPWLQNLKLLNISVGGAAVLLNTNVPIDEIPREYNGAILNLEETSAENMKIKVKRITPYVRESIPLNLAAKREHLNWYELALSFEKIPPRMQQELFFLVNSLSKKPTSN